MIDFELYRIFVEVAKEGNITKASEKLNNWIKKNKEWNRKKK